MDRRLGSRFAQGCGCPARGRTPRSQVVPSGQSQRDNRRGRSDGNTVMHVRQPGADVVREAAAVSYADSAAQKSLPAGMFSPEALTSPSKSLT
jgi:hypothetical protein